MKRKIFKFLLGIIRKFVLTFKCDVFAAKCGLFQPRVIKYIDGGLASQMLMFARGYVVAKRRNLPLELDLEWFEHNCEDLLGNRNRLFLLFDAFPEIKKNYGNKSVTRSKIPKWFICLFSDEMESRELLLFKDSDLPRSVYLHQYRALGTQWFVDELSDLKKLFMFNLSLTPTEKGWAEDINRSNSCAVHVRKGDFIGSTHDVCSDDYYLNAIRKIHAEYPDCVFYFFTNDEKYVSELLQQVTCKYVLLTNRTENHPEVDLWLMMQCKHAIISNSGFSLIAALLSYSTDKKVIMPEYWHNGSFRERTKRINWLPGWTCIEP